MHAATDNIITLPFGDAHLNIPAESLVKVLMDGLMKRPAPQPVAVPRIGDVWPGHNGGIYAGMMRGRNGAADYPLILLPGETKGSHEHCVDWAASINGDLPYPEEQSLLFANLRELFKEEAYWSNKTHESESSDAWYQNFGYGLQCNGHKSAAVRAVAVSRLVNSVIQ